MNTTPNIVATFKGDYVGNNKHGIAELFKSKARKAAERQDVIGEAKDGLYYKKNNEWVKIPTSKIEQSVIMEAPARTKTEYQYNNIDWDGKRADKTIVTVDELKGIIGPKLLSVVSSNPEIYQNSSEMTWKPDVNPDVNKDGVVDIIRTLNSKNGKVCNAELLIRPLPK